MFYENNYYRIIAASWVVILLLIWVQYLFVAPFREATLMLLVFAPAVVLSYLLTNRWLPRAVQRKAMPIFALQFCCVVVSTAFIIAAIYWLIQWADAEQYISHSAILANKRSLLTHFLFLIPSIMVINFGFCGLRFLYEHVKLQRIHLETQLQALQSQITPHFMFNILNHIHILMQTNLDLASSLLLQYADILRYQLYSGQKESVKLEQEVQFLKNFVEIEKIRWGDQIDVRCTWQVEDECLDIPPLLFITFVENAFKHVSRYAHRQNYININFCQQGGFICLDIENSKADLPLKEKSSGLGLENIKNRLDILCRDRYRLSVEDQCPIYHSKLEIWQR